MRKDADVTTLVMVSEKAGDVLDLISDQWTDIAARIRTTVTEGR